MRPEAEPRSNAVSSRSTASLRSDLRSGPRLDPGLDPRSALRSNSRISPRPQAVALQPHAARRAIAFAPAADALRIRFRACTGALLSRGRASPQQVERHARRDHDHGARDGRSRVDLVRRTGARRYHTHHVFAPFSGAENSARVAPASAGFHSQAGGASQPPEPAQRVRRQQTPSTAHGRMATAVGRQNAAAARGPRSTYYGSIIS